MSTTEAPAQLRNPAAPFAVTRLAKATMTRKSASSSSNAPLPPPLPGTSLSVPPRKRQRTQKDRNTIEQRVEVLVQAKFGDLTDMEKSSTIIDGLTLRERLAKDKADKLLEGGRLSDSYITMIRRTWQNAGKRSLQYGKGEGEDKCCERLRNVLKVRFPVISAVQAPRVFSRINLAV